LSAADVQDSPFFLFSAILQVLVNRKRDRKWKHVHEPAAATGVADSPPSYGYSSDDQKYRVETPPSGERATKFIKK
jgi:hypothetical protein